MSTTKKFSGKAMGYLILLGLVVLSWAIFKILSPHNFGSFGNMLNYFQASLIATVGAVGFYFVMVMGMFDFSIGANIMLSAIVGCVFATRFNLGYFGLIVGCILTGTIVGALNDGLNGDPTMLIAKAILDGVASILFAASLGKGVYLSIVPIFFYQGGITLMARFIRPWLTDVLIGQMSCPGLFPVHKGLVALDDALRTGQVDHRRHLSGGFIQHRGNVLDRQPRVVFQNLQKLFHSSLLLLIPVLRNYISV